MIHTKHILTSAAIVAVLASTALNAITIDFAGNGGAGFIGNTRNFSGGGVTVSATAYYRTDDNSGGFSEAAVGQYSGGLGVINSFGFLGIGSDDHFVDNIGRLDFLLFSFSQPVIVNSIRLEAVESDSDFQIWIGNSSSPSGLYSGSALNYAGNGSNNTFAVNAGDLVGSYLLLGAQTNSDYDDEFKVRNLSFDLPSTSVPDGGSSIVLLGGALAMVGFLVRRRRVA